MLFLGTIAEWWRNRQRNIFHYHDGTGWCRADPVVVGYGFEEACPDYQRLFDTLAEDPQKVPVGPLRSSILDQQRAAARELASATRKVLGIPPIARTGKGGMSDSEVINVLARYLLFMNKLARKAELFQDWPEAESPSPPASTTPPSVESGIGENKPSNG